MKQKMFLMLMALVLISGVMYSVTALGVFIAKEPVKSIDMFPGKWYLQPPLDSNWYSVLSAQELSDSYDNYYSSEAYEVNKQSVLREEDFAYAFVYDARSNEYIQVFGSGTNHKKLMQVDYDDTKRFPVMWVYVKETNRNQLWVEYDIENMPSIEVFSITKGWNFLVITPDIIGKPIEDWQGTCNLEEFANWDDEIQQWVRIAPADLSSIVQEAKINNLVASALAVKVKGDCQFMISEVPEIPGLPN